MTDKGKNIREVMRQMKTLYEQIQLLLKTTDREMQDRSWASCAKYVTNFSRLIDSSDVWMTWCLARFYTNSEYKNLLPFVSVILDDDIGQIDEPVLTAGWFDSELGDKNFDYWWPAVHVRQHEIFSDGRLRNADTACINDWLSGGKTLGMPLVEIGSEQALVERIIDPLVEGLKEARK